jgi:hypothetical protein
MAACLTFLRRRLSQLLLFYSPKIFCGLLIVALPFAIIPAPQAVASASSVHIRIISFVDIYLFIRFLQLCQIGDAIGRRRSDDYCHYLIVGSDIR